MQSHCATLEQIEIKHRSIHTPTQMHNFASESVLLNRGRHVHYCQTVLRRPPSIFLQMYADTRIPE